MLRARSGDRVIVPSSINQGLAIRDIDDTVVHMDAVAPVSQGSMVGDTTEKGTASFVVRGTRGSFANVRGAKRVGTAPSILCGGSAVSEREH